MLSVFAAAWQLGHEAYGSFILPSPAETFTSLVALLENGQNADGSITLPEAIAPYMGGLTRLEPPARA